MVLDFREGWKSSAISNKGWTPKSRLGELDAMPSGGRVDRHPEIHRHWFDHKRLSGLYSEVFGKEEPPALILNPGLPYTEEEALLAEARCYTVRGPRAGRKFCYAPVSYEEIYRERIRALRRCIEAERPDWVEIVPIATLMDNGIYTIIRLSVVPPYPAVAILENTQERGNCRMHRPMLLAMTAARFPMLSTSSENGRCSR